MSSVFDWDVEIDTYRAANTRFTSHLTQPKVAPLIAPPPLPSSLRLSTTRTTTDAPSSLSADQQRPVTSGSPLPSHLPLSASISTPMSSASSNASASITRSPVPSPVLSHVMEELKAIYSPFPGNTFLLPPALYKQREPMRVIITAKKKMSAFSTTTPALSSPPAFADSRGLHEEKTACSSASSSESLPTGSSPTRSISASLPLFYTGRGSPPMRASTEPEQKESTEKRQVDDLDRDYDDDEDYDSEDDDEADEKRGSWLLFLHPSSGQRLYHNIVTGQTSWEKPLQYVEEKEQREKTYSEEDAETKKNMAGRASNVASLSSPDDLSDLTSLPSITPARVSSALSAIHKAVDAIVHKNVNLPLSIVQALGQQRTLLEQIISNLASLSHLHARNEVETLIAYDTLPWSFNSSAHNSYSIDAYRAAAIRADHSAAQEYDWACPQFYSNTCIQTASKYCMNVRLPSQDEAEVPRFVSLTFGDRDTPLSLIRQALSKSQLRLSSHSNLQSDPQSPLNDWAMKCVGSEDFAYSDRSILDYEFIRTAIKQHENIQVVIVRRSTCKSAQAALLASLNNTLPEQYVAKAHLELVPIDELSYVRTAEQVNSPHSWLTAAWTSTHDTHFPLKMHILGLDHFNDNSISRLENSNFVGFHVRSFFYYGSQKIEGSDRWTSEFPYLSQPRFQQRYVFPQLFYSTMPRELRVAFIIYGRRIEDPNPVMLAYLCQNIVDERGLVAHGRQTYRLWSCSASKSKKHGKDKQWVNAMGSDAMLFHSCPVQNYSERECVMLTVQWDEFALPLVYPIALPPAAFGARRNSSGAFVPSKSNAPLPKGVQKQLDQLLARDALHPITAQELAFIHFHRHDLTKIPHALSLFLSSVNWLSPESRQDAYDLITRWSPPYSPIAPMILLDVKYPDTRVRAHAISLLRRLSDDELAMYLLQLVQCLKYESYHSNALSAYLIERATAAPISVGVPLFWHLKCELHVSATCERYALILEELLSFSPHLAAELAKQQLVMSNLQRVSEMVQRWTRDQTGTYTEKVVEMEYSKEMRRLNEEILAPLNGFRSPLHPKVRVITLCVEKCRYMSSKMVPLWLVFVNADAFARASPAHPNNSISSVSNKRSSTGQQHHQNLSISFSNNNNNHGRHTSLNTQNGICSVISAPKQNSHPREFIFMIFKSGDDLRQDILTLQLLRLMDSLWMGHSLDLRLHPYQVCATGVNEHGDGIGLIEVVVNSDTTSRIQVKYGGKTLGALNKESLELFIREHNTGVVANTAGQGTAHQVAEVARSSYDLAVENFVHSCAGYLVATFVLGIGDRHNGNIMLTKKGHLFHIDFGHFLGNFKSKFGINRERAAFVFTPEMAYVMGGKASVQYKLFLALATKAFKVLRTSVSLLELMFLLMVSAGMPELQSHDDIAYMRNQLHLDVTESKAERKLTKEIDRSLASTYRLVDNAIHNWRHGG